jgi:hypothetical protein
VGVDSDGLVAVETDLGYRVELSEVRLAFDDLAFSAPAGELQTMRPSGTSRARAWLAALGDLAVPPAHAHPGHGSGGDVTGELPGHFVAAWRPGEGSELGRARLIAGAYESVSFTFSRASSGDGLGAGDELLGHTARLAGSARRGEWTTRFVVLIDSPEGRALTGVPCQLEVGEGMRATLGLQFLPLDPFEGDTPFDGIDFEALSGDGERLVISGDAREPALSRAYEDLRRAFQTHDHYGVAVRGEP